MIQFTNMNFVERWCYLMRITSMSKVTSGDKLGQDIYDYNGNVMLRKGVTLTYGYVDKLMKLGISYLYIMDDRLSDLEPPMSTELNRLKEQLAQSFHTMKKRMDFGLDSDLENINSILNDIVDFTVNNKDVNDICLCDLKTHDNYTYIHSLNSTLLSVFFGTQRKLTKSKSLELALGAFLHDIGKIDVPLPILNKNGIFTEEEFTVMKSHPIYGYNRSRIISCIEEDTRRVILEHHERVDGSGYPFGKVGREISDFSKIVSACDVYDALTGDRVYRKAFSHKEAYEHMLAGSGSLFDEDVISMFKDYFYIYPIGIKVRLSNGCEGFIIRNNKGFPDKPIIRIFTDENGQTTPPYEINLIETLNICIDDVIS